MLDRKRLQLINTGNHYFEFLNEDIQRVTESKSPAGLNGAVLKVIKGPGDFNENDPETIYGFLIVEGLHCFFNDQTATNAKEEFTKTLKHLQMQIQFSPSTSVIFSKILFATMLTEYNL